MILSGRCFISGRVVERDIEVDEGTVVRVERSIFGKKRTLGSGTLVLPAGVDMHVHFRDPGATHEEDFFTGGLAALHGGVTTVFDMPNTDPPVTTGQRFEEKMERVRTRSVVDFGLYAHLGWLEDARTIPSGRCAGFKAYLAPTTGALMTRKEDIAAYAGDDGLAPLPLLVHAEEPERFTGGPASDPEGYDRSRPEQAEVECITALLKGDRPPRLHLTHLTSPASVSRTCEEGVSFDVAPRHLLLDHSMRHIRGSGKVNPPLRSPETRGRLLELLRSGKVPILASDHAPHLPQDKASFPESLPGMPEIEWTLPILLGMVKRGVVPLNVVVRACAEAPGEFMHILKGKLQKGYDADLVLLRTGELRSVRSEPILSKCGWSPYTPFEALFPWRVLLRGEVVFDSGEFMGSRGCGHPVRSGG